MHRPVLDFGRTARAVGACLLAVVVLAPTLSQASVLCGMSGRTYAQRCPCAHDPGSAEGPTRVEGACCAPVEVDAIDAPRSEPERASLCAAALPVWSPSPDAPRPLLVEAHRWLRPQAARPPSTGPPAHIAFGRFLT